MSFLRSCLLGFMRQALSLGLAWLACEPQGYFSVHLSSDRLLYSSPLPALHVMGAGNLSQVLMHDLSRLRWGVGAEFTR